MFNSQGTAAQKQFNTKCQVIFFLYPWKWLGDRYSSKCYEYKALLRLCLSYSHNSLQFQECVKTSAANTELLIWIWWRKEKLQEGKMHLPPWDQLVSKVAK